VGNLEARRYFSDIRDIVRAYRLAALKGSGVYSWVQDAQFRFRNSSTD
jgi:hypothetical protein